jgi:hypothetical protein
MDSLLRRAILAVDHLAWYLTYHAGSRELRSR